MSKKRQEYEYTAIYKHPKKSKPQYMKVFSDSLADVLKHFPKVIRGGYILYGIH